MRVIRVQHTKAIWKKFQLAFYFEQKKLSKVI